MKYDFWKQLSPLDSFLILLNCVLLLVLFSAGGCQSTEANSLTGTAQLTTSEQQSTAQQQAAQQQAAQPPEAPPPIFTADDAAFIAAMLAP
jgi:hypothetical protein